MNNTMPEKIFFYLLILCGLLSPGIIGTVADDFEESSDILLRQKRVISRVPSEDVTMPIRGAGYLVIIRENMRINCVGSILSRHVVISIPQCVLFRASRYQVVSGTSRTDRGTRHSVTDIRKRFSGHPSRIADGIALLVVNPPFVYTTGTYVIPLYTGPLSQGTLGNIFGWGYNFRNTAERGTCIPSYLRSITVPIMAHQECANRYLPHTDITNNEFCTYHLLKHCGHSDGGAPFVINGHLAGVHLWSGPEGLQNDPQYPDVFVALQNSVYSHWIETNMNEIEEQIQNPVHNEQNHHN